MQQTERLTGHDLPLRGLRLRRGGLAAQGDEAVELRLQPLSAGQHGGGEFDGRDFLASDARTKLNGRQQAQIIAHWEHMLASDVVDDPHRAAPDASSPSPRAHDGTWGGDGRAVAAYQVPAGNSRLRGGSAPARVQVKAAHLQANDSARVSSAALIPRSRCRAIRFNRCNAASSAA
ncbi:hypothetical protein ACVISU_002696 [Bradyrhizobium sp. USDA 4452]